MVFDTENIHDDLQHVVMTDVMLSPGTTSLGIINVGRGRFSTHGPTFRKSTGPRQRKSRVFKILPEKHILARLSIPLLSKAYPFMVYIAM
jgi:hypothetical protein